MTKVQELKDEIYLIQSNCSHLWVHQRQIIPIESLVSGTYVGHAAGPIKVGRDPDQEEHFGIHLICRDWIKVFKGHISSTCPKCLVPLKERGMYPSRREDYFGISHLYFGIMLRSCPECGFTVACDEWDQ